MEALEQHELPPISEGIQVGIDIGQRTDPTAIVVIERMLRGRIQGFDTYFGRPLPPTEGKVHYEARHMERLPLGTTYPKVAERLAEIVGKLPLGTLIPDVDGRLARLYDHLPRRRLIGVYIDATGVGLPVCDVMREAGVDVTPVYITSGRAVTEVHGEIHLSKEQMISRLQALSQQHRIHLPDTPEAVAMSQELLDFEIRVTDHANLQFEAKVGSHDDYVTALGLATWGTGAGVITVGDAPQALQDFWDGRGVYW